MDTFLSSFRYVSELLGYAAIGPISLFARLIGNGAYTNVPIAITRDWECRITDHSLLLDDEWNNYLENSGITIIGWNRVRKIMTESIPDIAKFIQENPY